MKLTIVQPNTAEPVSSELIDKLYYVARSGILTNDSTFEGYITTPAAYEDAVEYLNNNYPNLTIGAISYYIRFVDPKVLEVFLNAGVGDGVGITAAQAAVANVVDKLKNNTEVTSFDELVYFPATSWPAVYDFTGCTNLKSIDMTGKENTPFKIPSSCGIEYFLGANGPKGVWRSSNQIDSNPNIYELEIMPNGVRNYSTNDYRGLTNLQKVTINSTDGTRFGWYNFIEIRQGGKIDAYCSSLEKWMSYSFGGGCNPMNTNGGDLYINNEKLVNLVVPETVTTIPESNFAGCKSIETAVIHNAVTIINQYAFQNCTNLVIQNLNLPQLSSLGARAFNGTRIIQVSDLGTISSIAEAVFQNCQSLTSVVLPQTCTTLGNDSFNNCSTLTTINTTNITSIGSRCFRSCVLLQTIDLTNVTQLGDRAFQYCTILSKYNGSSSTDGVLNIPNLQTITGPWAFEGNNALLDVQSLGSVTSLPQGTFNSCINLQKINLTNITSISDRCFNGCQNLEYFGGSGSNAGELSLPNLITIGSLAFNSCKKLASITSLGTITNIPDECFAHCFVLASVTIPSTVTTVGKYSFQFCGLTSLVVPSTVTSFGVAGNSQTPIYGCGQLISLEFEATTPPSVSSSLLSGCNNATIYVPDASVNTYKAANGFSDYASRIKGISEKPS